LVDIVNSVSGASGILNFIISLITGFISWVQAMPIFLKVCCALIGISIAYVVYEFKYGVKQIPRQIQI